MIKVALNGFGRIGRRVFRLLHEHPHIEVVAINDLADSKTLSHLLKYDSIHGIYKASITYSDEHIIVNGRSITFSNHLQPKDTNWNDVDIVIEATGKFKSRADLQHHIKNGAKKVILAVPPQEDNIPTVVLGVNDSILSDSETIISNASCTTNNAAPMISVIHELAEIKQAYITTVHS